MQVPSCSTYTLCVPRYNLESSDAYDQNHIIGGKADHMSRSTE